MNRLVVLALLLSLLQLAALTVIIYLLLRPDVDRPLPAVGGGLVEQDSETPVAHVPPTDAGIIRRIVRTELERFSRSRVVATARDDDEAVEPAANDARVALVQEAIATYVAYGGISERQMDELEREISMLDPSSQQMLLAELYGAINTGRMTVRR